MFLPSALSDTAKSQQEFALCALCFTSLQELPGCGAGHRAPTATPLPFPHYVWKERSRGALGIRGKKVQRVKDLCGRNFFLLFHLLTPCLTPLWGNLKRDEMSLLCFQSFSLQGLGLQHLLVIPRPLVRTRTQGRGINKDGDCKDQLGNFEKNNSGGECDLEGQTMSFKVKQTGRGERNYLKV